MNIDRDKHSTGLLTFSEVEPIFKYYLACWPNELALRWARIVWQTLTEAGATVYTTEKEELTVRSYAGVLSLVYYEYCNRSAWHEHGSFRYWSDEILKNLENDLPKATEKIEELLFAATRPLFERIGEVEVPLEFWVSCVESTRGFPVTVEETVKLYRQFVTNLNYDPMYDGGKQFLLGGVDNFHGYNSVSGLGIFS